MIPSFVSPPGLLAAVALAAYLVGSISFGLLMARVFGLGDLRAIGSGNVGATNVLRTGNKLAALLTLLLDAGKGAAAVLAARWAVGEDAAQIAAFTAFLGHLYPVWASFRGGKGVATFLGVVLALHWPLGLACCLVWLAVARLTRLSSAGALAAAAAAAPLAPLMGAIEAVGLCLLLAGLVYLRHAANIRRILAGTEPRIGENK